MEHLLKCPRCDGSLQKKLPHFHCEDCDEKISTIGNGVPVFLENFEHNAVKSHQKKSSLPKRMMKKVLQAPHHSVYPNLRPSYKESDELIELLKTVPAGATIINIGSLSKCLKEHHDGIKNLDICYYPNVDVIADAKQLPFKEGSVDMIIFKNVLEHVKEPGKVLKEIQRVLKPGGKLYVKIPFLQPFHAVPDDFQRYTRSGIKELFKEYHEHDFGVAVGGGSMIAWIVREYLAILTSFGSETLYKMGITFWGWITFWLKYTDLLLKNNKLSDRVASAFYGVYQKPYE